MTTTGRDDTRAGRAVVIGADRPGAAEVFGGAFDRVLTTTYAEVDADLAAERAAGGDIEPVIFVGVAAGPGMQRGVDAALDLLRRDAATAASNDGSTLELAFEVPWDLDTLDHLRMRLTDPDAPQLSDVRRYRDRPCLVVGGAPAGPVEDRAWLIDALLTAGTTAPDARVAHQERVAAEWERSAAAEQVRRRDEQLRDRGAELGVVRGELAAARRRLRELRRTRRGSTEQGRGVAHRSATARGLAGDVARRVSGGRGARVGLVVIVLAAMTVLLAPALVLGLLAGEVGVAVGLALGAVLLALAAVGGAVVLTQRAVVSRVDLLQRQVGRQGRDAAVFARRQLNLTREACSGRQQEEELLTDVLRRLRGVPKLVRDTVAQEGLTTRRQVQALLNLASLTPARAALPPLGGWAASPDFAVEVLDRLIVERPRVIVEAGSGASTLLLALAARENDIDTRIVALEHHAHYAARTRELLERHGVADRAEVRFAPLARTHVPGHLTPWYDERAIADLDDVGLLVIDGPPTATGPAARYPAVPLLRDRLAPRCSIVVDDTRRESDRDVVERWAGLLPDFELRELPFEKGAMVLQRV